MPEKARKAAAAAPTLDFRKNMLATSQNHRRKNTRLFSDSWRGFRGVKPLKSLRPYGTARIPALPAAASLTRPWARKPQGGLFRRLIHPISTNQTHASRVHLPRIPENHMADHDLFFSRTGMDRGRVQQTVDQALTGSDDG